MPAGLIIMLAIMFCIRENRGTRVMVAPTGHLGMCWHNLFKKRVAPMGHLDLCRQKFVREMGCPPGRRSGQDKLPTRTKTPTEWHCSILIPPDPSGSHISNQLQQLHGFHPFGAAAKPFFKRRVGQKAVLAFGVDVQSADYAVFVHGFIEPDAV